MAEYPPILLGGPGISSVKKIRGNKVAGVKFLKNVPLSGILLNIKQAISQQRCIVKNLRLYLSD